MKRRTDGKEIVRQMLGTSPGQKKRDLIFCFSHESEFGRRLEESLRQGLVLSYPSLRSSTALTAAFFLAVLLQIASVCALGLSSDAYFSTRLSFWTLR